MRSLANGAEKDVEKKRSGKNFSWKEMLIATTTYALITSAAFYLMREFSIPGAMMSLGAAVSLLLAITAFTPHRYKSLDFARKVGLVGLIVSLTLLTMLMYMDVQLSIWHVGALLVLPMLRSRLFEFRQKKTGSGIHQ